MPQNTRISEATANTYMTNWSSYVANNPTALRSLFSDNNGSLLAGFKMSFQEFMYLIAPIGIEHFKVRIGIDASSKLTLVVWGTDSDGTTVTAYNALNDYTTAQYSGAKFEAYPAIPNVISPVLGKIWLADWENIGSSVSVELFKVYGQTLNGYTAIARDFYDVLASHTSSSNIQNVNVNFCFCNRKDGAANTDGTVSVMLYSPNLDNTVGYLLDFLRPCPKTC